jgi:Arm DNA-binding domain
LDPLIKSYRRRSSARFFSIPWESVIQSSANVLAAGEFRALLLNSVSVATWWRHTGLPPPLAPGDGRSRQPGMDSMPSITKRFVDAAAPGRHYDDKLPGFGLYVGASGARSYFLEYRPGVVVAYTSAGFPSASTARRGARRRRATRPSSTSPR